MATNPYVNKVIYQGQVLIDLSEDTITEDKVLDGYVAHDGTGRRFVGTAAVPVILNVSNATASKISGTDDDYIITFT